MPKMRSFAGFPPALHPGYGPYAGVVEDVHDGDTVSVSCDVGLESFPCVWVRLSGVKAPESWQPGGPESTAKLLEMIPLGSHIRLTTEKTLVGTERRSAARYAGLIENLEGNVNERIEAWIRAQGYGLGS